MKWTTIPRAGLTYRLIFFVPIPLIIPGKCMKQAVDETGYNYNLCDEAQLNVQTKTFNGTRCVIPDHISNTSDHN